MGHKYVAHGHDGRIHNVESNHHHSNYSESEFKRVLAKVIEGAASGAGNAVTTIVITKFLHKP